MVRIGELLGALSLATDLAAGTPVETSLRLCVLGTRLGRVLGWPDDGEIRRVTLLRHLGCTAFAHEAARFGGDDQDMLATYAGVDLTRRGKLVGRTMTRLAKGAPFGKRLAAIGRAVVNPGAGAALMTAQCAQAAALAEDLRMPPGVVEALGQIYERHDGRGAPRHLAGEAIRPSARILHLAEVVEIHHRSHGRDAAVDEVQRRRGRHFAPEVADAFLAEHDQLWDALEATSVWDLYLDADDPDQPELDLERVASAFGRFADLKSPYMHGHSTAVAALASGAAGPGETAELIRVAALLHDLGTVSVPNGIWDKPGPLNASEWERVRLHGYQTQRILAQTPLLADIAAVAGAHHERLDGSGYHRAIGAPMLDREARLIAACDAYQSMREARAHRPARSADDAAAALGEDARTGRLCPRAVDEVLAAAGHRRAERTLPAGLTPREVEVLVLVARGSTNKQIASALGIAVRTANHHVEHIYAKIEVTTRAAAALFAVRHDLVSTAAGAE